MGEELLFWYGKNYSPKEDALGRKRASRNPTPTYSMFMDVNGEDDDDEEEDFKQSAPKRQKTGE